MTRLAVPFAGKRVEATDASSWLRLTAAGAVLFGPARMALIKAARTGDRSRLHRMERAFAIATSKALGMRVSVEGLDNVDPTGQYLVAPLHESFVDVLCVLGLPLDLAFAARDELFDWPTLGPYLQASGQANIPTSHGPAAYRAIRRGAERAFDAGESFVVFPQGTILGIESSFRPGAFRVAEQLGRPVLPIAISGTHRVWEHPFDPIVRTGVSVSFNVLEPVAPGDIVEKTRQLERDMKQRALGSEIAPRHFDPDRDGWWDDYPYEIDPDFPELVEKVARHRENLLPVGGDKPLAE